MVTSNRRKDPPCIGEFALLSLQNLHPVNAWRSPIFRLAGDNTSHAAHTPFQINSKSQTCHFTLLKISRIKERAANIMPSPLQAFFIYRLLRESSLTAITQNDQSNRVIAPSRTDFQTPILSPVGKKERVFRNPKSYQKRMRKRQDLHNSARFGSIAGIFRQGSQQ